MDEVEKVLGWVECQLELRQLLDEGLAVGALQLPQAVWILLHRSIQDLPVIADLIAAKGVHRPIPGDVRQEQGSGSTLAARLFSRLGQQALGQVQEQFRHLLHSQRRPDSQPSARSPFILRLDGR